MGELQIVNYIEIDGQEVLLDALSDDQKQKVAETLQERLMGTAGYRRCTA